MVHAPNFVGPPLPRAPFPPWPISFQKWHIPNCVLASNIGLIRRSYGALTMIHQPGLTPILKVSIPPGSLGHVLFPLFEFDEAMFTVEDSSVPNCVHHG